MSLVTVPIGQVLTVTADAGSYGTVWHDGTKDQWTVSAKSPLRLGAGRYRIETVTGSVSHSVDDPTVAALEATLPRATEIIESATVIAKAINMPLSDKFKRLADRARSVPASLSARADDAFGRLDAVEARGDAAFSGLGAVLTDVEQGVAAAEDALNQLTNGAPA